MAHDALARRRLGVWPPRQIWVRLALIYAAARVFTTLLFIAASALAPADSRHGAHAGFARLAMGWDAQWYWVIATSGYPAELPVGEDSVVRENAWAFMPVYPVLARIVAMPLTLLFGVDMWGVGAVLISLLAGYGACLVLFTLVRSRIGESASIWTVAFFASAPLAALFQVAYAESLFLLWLLLSLRLLQLRRFAWLYALVPLMAYTRPGVLAFALTLGLYGVWRWSRRRFDRLPAGQIAHIIALGALATLAGFSWPLIAGWVTGVPDAYMQTELAWRRGWIGADHVFLPFSGWFEGAHIWLEQIAVWPPGTGLVVGAALGIGVFIWIAWDPRVRRLGMETRLWAASYALYLLAVFFPQSSLFRLLVPFSPLWGALAQPRSPWWRGGALAVSALLQWWWVWNMYGLGQAYWQVP